MYHLTHTLSIPNVSVTTQLTVAGQRFFGQFAKGICVIAGFEVSFAIAMKVNNVEGAPKGTTLNLPEANIWPRRPKPV